MLRNCYLFFVFALLAVSYGNSQKSSILWQKTIGGKGDDNITTITKDQSGNIYVLGSVQSKVNGQNYFNNDVFISKLNQSGEQLWRKTIGGSGDEFGYALKFDSHNEIIALLSSNSMDNGFTSDGYEDIYMYRLSEEGNIISKHKYGGQFIDIPSDIIQRKNGDYIFFGSSRSHDGDLTENFGMFDFWLVNIDYNGNIKWQRSYGATDDEIAQKVIELDNQDLVLLGNSTSYDGAYSDNVGDADIVLINTNSNGELLWQKSYGGQFNETANDILVEENGNFLVCGSTFSYLFDVSYNAGGSDIWIFEAESNGELIREKTFGSDGNESLAGMEKTPDGYILLGTTSSEYLNDASNNGAQDLWLYELNMDLELTNQALFGASGFDSGNALLLQNDGTIIIGGSTNSSDGLIYENNGGNDALLLKVGEFYSKEHQKAWIHPNPSSGIFYVNQLPENSSINVYNHNGQVLFDLHEAGPYAAILDLSKLPAGLYILTITSTEGQESHKLIVQ